MIENLEKCICTFFSIDKDLLIGKNHLKQPSLARGYLWYILHYDYKLSDRYIAIAYKRNTRTVRKMIAKMKYSIDNLKYYKNDYNIIKSLIV